MPAGFDDKNVIGLMESTIENRFEGSWASELSFYNPNSDSEVEKYGIFGGYSKMREWLGERQLNEVGKKSYEIRNKEYESSCSVKQRLLDRDKSGLLQAHLDNWVDGTISYQWEDLLTDLINDAGTRTCFDGKTFFATDHQFGSETAQKNSVTSSEVTALNVGTATAPTPAEMASAIMGLVGYMMTIQDDKNRYINGSARKFTVAVSTVDLFTALSTALSSTVVSGNVDNPLKGFLSTGFQFRPLLIPAFSNATAKIRVFRTDGAMKPFILQEEQGVQYSSIGMGSEYYFKNKAILIGVDTCRGAGYGDWKSAIEGTLS